MPEMKTSGSSSRRGRTVALNSALSDRLLLSPFARLVVHRDRKLDPHLRVHVPWCAALGIGQSQPSEADFGAVLSLGRDRELHLAALDRRLSNPAAPQLYVEQKR